MNCKNCGKSQAECNWAFDKDNGGCCNNCTHGSFGMKALIIAGIIVLVVALSVFSVSLNLNKGAASSAAKLVKKDLPEATYASCTAGYFSYNQLFPATCTVELCHKYDSCNLVKVQVYPDGRINKIG